MKKAILILGIIIAGITGVVFGQDYAAIAKDAAAKTELILSGSASCNCDITIPASAWYVDIDKKGNSNAYVIAPKPGQTVCFADGVRGPIELHNINAVSGLPITFASCSGITLKGSAGQHVVQFFNSSFVRVSGEQGPIDITGGGHGLYFRDRSTDVEANSIWFHDLGYSGFEAKTDPTCDPKTWRGAFTLRNPVVKNCRFTDIATGEAIYIGESHYATTFPLSGCASGVKAAQEHDVVGATVTGCTFKKIGRDAIQIGASTLMVVTYNNIEEFGMTNEYGQGSGVTWNPGSTGEVAYNTINTGSGFGILAQGRGSGSIHHNVIRNTGTAVDGGGIMAAAYTPIDNDGYKIYNNTIIDIKRVAIEYYSPVNLYNNILPKGVPIKKGGSAGVLTQTNNFELSGISGQLDASYVPTATSTVPAGVGYKDYVKPFTIKVVEPGTIVVETTGTLEEVYITTPSGKRIKLK
jgi:hypothetical protein